MLRNLTSGDYGILNSLLSMFIILSIPIGTVRTAIVKFIASFSVHNQWGKIRHLLFSLGKKVFLASGIIFLMIILAKTYIANFLQIPNQNLIIMLALAVFFAGIMPLVTGGLQGLQRFGFLGLSNVASGGLKLILGIILVSFGLGVMGSMSAFVVSNSIGFALALVSLVYFVRKNSNTDSDETVDFSEVYRYFYPVAITSFCIMILTNIDIILVKAFFKPEEAGLYSTAQMVGKIIYFLPAAVGVVMFPKVSASHAQSKDTLPILKRSLVMVSSLCGTASLICVLFPLAVIKLLSGKAYPELLPLVRLFAVTMVPFTLVYVISLYQLSIHRVKFIFPLVFFTFLQVVLISLFHNTLSSVLYIMLCNAIILLVIMLRSLKQ